MEITRSSLDTAAGPDEWFTGAVYIDSVAAPSNGSRLHASSVHFTPGARTAWHTHPNGQTIFVTEGMGLAQSRGGAIKAIAVLSEQKLPQLPNVATAASAGYSDINIRSWNALFLPKGVPDEARTRLARALRFALSDRNLRDQMTAVGVDLPDPDKASSAEVTALIEKGIKNDVPVLRARGESLD
jgi:hypothetical protein